MPSAPSASTRYTIERHAPPRRPSHPSLAGQSLIAFDQRDQPSHVARPRCYPLVVDPIICKKRLTKVLMDGGSCLNILYVDTLDAMRIPQSELRLVSSPFHGVIPGT